MLLYEKNGTGNGDAAHNNDTTLKRWSGGVVVGNAILDYVVSISRS